MAAPNASTPRGSGGADVFAALRQDDAAALSRFSADAMRARDEVCFTGCTQHYAAVWTAVARLLHGRGGRRTLGRSWNVSSSLCLASAAALPRCFWTRAAGFPVVLSS